MGFVQADGVQRRLALNIVELEGVKGFSGYSRSYQSLKDNSIIEGLYGRFILCRGQAAEAMI